jgi:transcriptional regulator with GAF, ATPase, and Fis domain
MSQAKHNKQVTSQSKFGFQKSDIGFRFRSVERRFKREVFNFFVDHCCLRNNGVQIKELLENLERSILIRALTRCNGNQKLAAECLGLKPTTLHEKVKRYHIHFRKQPIQEAVWSESAD